LAKDGSPPTAEADDQQPAQSHHITLGKDTATGSLVTLTNPDRKQGTYVVGLTGTGKTTLLLNIALADIANGDGLCVLDPHGDWTSDIIQRVPEHREDDVILFDPADTDRPFGLNLFECADTNDPNLVDLVCSQAIGTFWKLFYYSWGPQMEDLLRNVSLTLIYNQFPDDPDNSATMADIPALLTDEDYRAGLVKNIPAHADQVRLFWEKTYNPLGARYPHKQLEYSMSTLNKVRRFLLNTTIRNIVGQPQSSFDLRQVMDEGKILLVNLSKGKLGEDNSSLLGSIIVGKILIAALSRADVPPERRKAFHLIVDEYQSFATSSFPTLQSEARKFNIDTIVAHQYRDQLDDLNKGSTLNVGNMIVFRVTGEDAERLAAQFDNTPPPPIIIGEHVPRTQSGNPWFDLKKGTHPNPRVKDLVNFLSSYLTPLRHDLGGTLTSWGKSAKQDFYDSRYRVTPAEVAASEQKDIQFFERKLDDYIYKRLRGQSKAHLEAMWNQHLWRAGPMMFTERDLIDPDQSIDVRSEIDPLRKQISELEAQVYGSKPKKPATEEQKQRLKQEEQRIHKRAIELRAREKQLKNQYRYQLQKEYYQYLEELISLLEKEPPTVASALAVPIYEKPRAYSDVQQETANKLTTLPNYQARTILVRGTGRTEHTIETLLPDPVDPDRSENTTQRIRERSRQMCGRPRQEVEQRMTKRGIHEPREGAVYYEPMGESSNLPPQDEI
jgi:hypothetical protein